MKSKELNKDLQPTEIKTKYKSNPKMKKTQNEIK